MNRNYFIDKSSKIKFYCNIRYRRQYTGDEELNYINYSDLIITIIIYLL